MQTHAPAEVILVDNGSSDGSVEWVHRTFPAVRLIALNQNRGFCEGNNVGIATTSTDLVVLLNSDTEMDTGTMAALVAAAATSPDAGSFACQMVRFADRDRIDNVGIRVTAWGRAEQLGAGEPRAAHAKPRYVFGASGGAVAYRRALIEKVGMLDEAFFSHVEDVDLAWRSQLAGFRCFYVPEAVVYHIGGASSQAVSEQVLFRIQRNTTWAFLKNTPLALLPFVAPIHAAYCAYWIARALLTGHGRTVARAKWHAIRDWRDILKKRRAIQRTRTRSAWEMLRIYNSS